MTDKILNAEFAMQGKYMFQDIENVKEIVGKSGNTFHCKVLKYLQEKGWTVLISPYYNDNVTNKPREIDLIAEKAFDANDRLKKSLRTINVKLFIECKYISLNTVFWFHNKDKQKAQGLVKQTTLLQTNDMYTNKHHYLGEVKNVAKLFEGQRKKSEDNDIFYKALNQSLNAMVYYRNQGSILEVPNARAILCTLNYPVIVCNSFENLYRVDTDTDADPLKITENFLLEVNYAYMTSNGSRKNEYFLIDILQFELFDNFLKQIEVDAGLVSFSQGGFLKRE
jgi:hypothetical protein